MTSQEMSIALLQELQKMDSAALEDFQPEEQSYFLNKAVDTFIKMRLGASSDPKKLGFEGNQKRLDDLRSLVRSLFEEVAHVPGTTKYAVEFPGDYLYMIDITGKVSVMDCQGDETGSSKTILCPITPAHELSQTLINPFRKPNKEKIIVTYRNNKIEARVDSKWYILKGLNLTYIKKPDIIDVTLSGAGDCNLPEHTHSQIVDLAVRHILEVVESPRVQTQPINLQLND